MTSEKIGGSGVISTLGTWYGGVVMGVLLSFSEAAILYRNFNSAPSQQQNIIVGATCHSQHLLLLAANTIIFCFCNGAQLKCLYKMAASLKGKRTPITTPPYQVPSVDITPDPPIFSLVTTFKDPDN